MFVLAVVRTRGSSTGYGLKAFGSEGCCPNAGSPPVFAGAVLASLALGGM